ncbi:MAG: hypothetical protein KDK91_25980 [Gammaproteobacteria bacterium]|nr:hypothetical protein [Gammaproteobacteria bacterium]
MTQRGEVGSPGTRAAAAKGARSIPGRSGGPAAAVQGRPRPSSRSIDLGNRAGAQGGTAARPSSDGNEHGNAEARGEIAGDASSRRGSRRSEALSPSPVNDRLLISSDAQAALAERKRQAALDVAFQEEREAEREMQLSTGAMVPAHVLRDAKERRKQLPSDAADERAVDPSGHVYTGGATEAIAAAGRVPAAANHAPSAVSARAPTATGAVSLSAFTEAARRDSAVMLERPPTLDLALLANVERGDEVRVEPVPDQTQALFEETLQIVRKEVEDESVNAGEQPPAAERSERGAATFVPQNKDLRALYHLAEAVGGYETFHELNSQHAPINLLSTRFAEKARRGRLSEREVSVLRELQQSIRVAIKNAGLYLRNVAVSELSYTEICELHDTIVEARKKAAKLDEVLGLHYMHEVEWAVERLHEFRVKMNNVERSVSGVFFVNSEVMFVPTNELIKCVNALFEGVGNAYLARHINGVLLLAARNLLIEVASFYSYYGKEQIYHLFRRSGSTLNTHAISMRVRREIRRLFEACQRDNKLVLTRVMRDAERKFEVSVEAIQAEAELIAVDAVTRLAPPPDSNKGPPPKQGLWRRMVGWMTGRRSSAVAP